MLRICRALTAVSVMATACAKPAAPSMEAELEVYSWWKASGEVEALRKLPVVYQREHPQVTVLGVDEGEGQQSSEPDRALTRRMLLDVPPNTFQANAGADLLQWARVDYQLSPIGAGGASAQVEPEASGANMLLPRRFEEFEEFEAVYPEVRDAVCALHADASAFFGVPLNVHRANVLYYNKEMIDPVQIDALSSAEQLCAVAAAGELPFEIAIAPTDVMLSFAFENLLLGLSGKDFYESLWRGLPTDGWRDEVRATLTCLGHLSPYFKRSTGWVDQIGSMVNEDAAVTVVGDWANPEFRPALVDRGTTANNVASDSDSVEPPAVEAVIGRMPFPGTEGLFVFTSDTFPQPTMASHKSQTGDLLRSFLSLETQLAFSAAKGSIPALSTQLDGLSELQEGGRHQPLFPVDWMVQTQQDFENLEKVLATSGWFPSFISEARLRDALIDLVFPQAVGAAVETRITNVLDLLESNLYLFRHWQDRVGHCNEGAE